MSVPKSKNAKIKIKIYNTNIYYYLSHRICIPLFLRPIEVNKPWWDGWMTKRMDRWMKWCFTTSFTICNILYSPFVKVCCALPYWWPQPSLLTHKNTTTLLKNAWSSNCPLTWGLRFFSTQIATSEIFFINFSKKTL